MKHLTNIALGLVLLFALRVNAQEQAKLFSMHGDLGIWYEGYGLELTPGSPNPGFYKARRPWNLFRYSFNPIFNIGKWAIPFNFNFSPQQYNFITSVPADKQSVWQFLTNPANNFGIRPKIGNTELLLGTQYLKFSDLTTGDLGIFGYGINLSPGKFRFKLFNGVSQSPVNYVAPSIPQPNGVVGAYQRNQWMAQLGLEKEGRYFAGFNMVRSADNRSSVTFPPLFPITPQENMVVSFLANVVTDHGWKYQIELGQSFYTRDINAPLSVTPVQDFMPFLNSHTTTGKDNALKAGIVKKGKEWEIGLKFNYFGAGYYTAGYPYMNNDKMEYLLNTRFNMWKKKINVVASLGQRFGNLSRISGLDLSKQIIANVNVFTQFTDGFTLNTSFNNYGFNTPGISGYKSVSNELGINPAYTWSNNTMSNLLSGTYTWSKYDETILNVTTPNNTHTVLLLYVPTFFNSKISPDFSVMWFKNSAPLIQLNLITASGGMNWKLNKKFKYKGQLQYSLSMLTPFTANKNLLASSGFDWDILKKLTWQLFVTANVYHFGTELPGGSMLPPYSGVPGYLESTWRTGLQYKF